MPRANSITKRMQRNARNGFTVLNYNDLIKNNGMYKKQNKARLANRNIAYDMSRGFFYKDDDSWSGRPENLPKRAVRLANGRTVYVYDSGDRSGKFIPFSRMEDDANLSKYIEDTNFTWSVEGCGHIKQLDYSPRRSVMRVEFQEQTDPVTGKTWGRADVAFFFNVPSAVFGELYYLAQTKSTGAPTSTGRTRHNLGIRFWDLVRIRGSLYGSRFPYSVTNIAPRERAVFGPLDAMRGGGRKVAGTKTKAAEAERKLGLSSEAPAKKQNAQAQYTDAQVLEELGSNDAGYVKKYLDDIGKRASGYSSMRTLGEKYNFLKSHNMLRDE